MDHFELVSEFEPTGDQPEAIRQLVSGFKQGNQFETLLGVQEKRLQRQMSFRN